MVTLALQQVSVLARFRNIEVLVAHGYFLGDEMGNTAYVDISKLQNVLLHLDCGTCVCVRGSLGNDKYLSPGRVFSATAFGHIGRVVRN